MSTNLDIKAILFDLDGTLIDTAGEIADALNDTLNDFMLEPIDEGQIRNWIGKGGGPLLRAGLAKALAKNDAQLDQWPDFARAQIQFKQHYAQRTATRSALYPQVIETLERLKSAKIKLGLLTNKDLQFSLIALDHFKLDHYFELLICGDSLASKKPDPAGAYQAMSVFGTTPAQTLLVGDSRVDVQAARNAGMPIWAVPYGYNFGESIAKAGPDKIIENFAELLVFSRGD